MRNQRLQENELFAWLTQELQAGLGAGWRVDLSTQAVPGRDRELDAVATMRAPDGTAATLLIEVKDRPTPSTALQLAEYFKRAVADQRAASAMLVAPYLGPRVREECRRLGLAYADKTGAWSLRFERPAISWERTGAPKNPEPESRGFASLQGKSTARVLRTLVDYEPPFVLTELAEMARVTTPTAYKVLTLLEGEGVIEREPRGAVRRVDWRGLLERWAKDYELEKQNVVRRYLAPRGAQQILNRLRATVANVEAKPGYRWALTGAWAARAEVDLLASPRLVIYASESSRLEEELDLRPSTTVGSNVAVLLPKDERMFEEAVQRDGIWCAPWSQIVIDLLGGTDREPSAGENLLNWMELNERRWRSRRGRRGS